MIEEMEKEFEEKFVRSEGNPDQDNYGERYIDEEPYKVWQWIETKIDEAKEEGFNAGCDYIDKIKSKPYEPYFGWCDVEGCNGEGASGGVYWRETGYWTICSKCGDKARAKQPPPKMKQSAIDRENSRDKITRELPTKGE